jgi:hypothetical protein
MVWAWTAMLVNATANRPQTAGQRREKIDGDTGSSL